MVQQDEKAKKMSAFAVQKIRKKGVKLEPETKRQLLESVQKIYSDKKFNKKVKSIAEGYEKKMKTKKLPKNQKQQKSEEKTVEADQSTAMPTGQTGTDAPLSWYDAPKSNGKRSKLFSSEEAIPIDVRGKGNSSKKNLQAEKMKSKKSATLKSEEVNTEPKFSPLPKPKKRSRGDKMTNQSASNGDNSKKVRLEAWSPPQDIIQKYQPDLLQATGSGKKKTSQEINGESSYKKAGNKQKQQPFKGQDITNGVKDHAVDDETDSDGDGSSMTVEHCNPEEVSKQLFTRLIHPHKPKSFFTNYWLKKPLHIKRKDNSYYEDDSWFSTNKLDEILTERQLRFGTNIDLTTYKDGKRETHNPAGRAYPAIVWDHYQTYCDETWYLLSTLQDLFGCMVGANVYLTPPGTQGFAPHFDDIEAFVLQLEGKKHWRVYGPRSDSDIAPLHSSPNLTQEELGKPILDCVLEPGDLLYFPRGSIHQAMAQDDCHSLHMTVSTHQRNTWSDLLQLMIPAALANATDEDAEFRESLPNDYLNYTGIAFQDQDGLQRKQFLEKVQKLMEKLVFYSPVDGACDLMAKKFIHDSLPPCLNPTERHFSVAEQGEKWVDGEVKDIVELQPDTRIRLMRKHSLRIINEQIGNESQTSADEGSSCAVRVYYNTDNDRLYHGNSLQYFEVEGDLAPAIEHLQLTFPEFVAVDDLPLEDITSKLDVVMRLYDRGLVVTEDLLVPDDLLDDESSLEEDSETEDEDTSDDAL